MTDTNAFYSVAGLCIVSRHSYRKCGNSVNQSIIFQAMTKNYDVLSTFA